MDALPYVNVCEHKAMMHKRIVCHKIYKQIHLIFDFERLRHIHFHKYFHNPENLLLLNFVVVRCCLQQYFQGLLLLMGVLL